MDWRISGQSQAIILQFMADGQFVTPDASSVFLTVRGNDGVALPGYENAPQIDITSTQFSTVVTDTLNTIADGAVFESRFVRLDFTVGGVPHHVTHTYRLHNFIPHAVSGAEVRALIGADYQELPDSDIDVISAYFDLLTTYGDTLKQALVRPDSVSLKANKAIAIKAALNVFPSLQSRLLKTEKMDNAGYTRNDIDFEKLGASLDASLTECLDAIVSAIDGTSFVVELPTLFAVTKQTDRITNSDS